MSSDPDVKAAVEAIRRSPTFMGCEFHGKTTNADCETCLCFLEDTLLTAQKAVAAARPIIEAEVRDEAADAILRDCRAERHSLSENRVCRYCDRAARIARGND